MPPPSPVAQRQAGAFASKRGHAPPLSRRPTAGRRIRPQARAWGRGQVVGLLGATGAVVSGVQWAALEGGHVAAFRQASATAPRAPWIIQARRHGHIGIFKGICSRLGRLDARAWAHAHTHTHAHARTHTYTRTGTQAQTHRREWPGAKGRVAAAATAWPGIDGPSPQRDPPGSCGGGCAPRAQQGRSAAGFPARI